MRYALQAQKAMREGDFHNAIQYGKLAVSYNQNEPSYYFLLAECQVRNPEARWQRLAEARGGRVDDQIEPAPGYSRQPAAGQVAHLGEQADQRYGFLNSAIGYMKRLRRLCQQRGENSSGRAAGAQHQNALAVDRNAEIFHQVAQ